MRGNYLWLCGALLAILLRGPMAEARVVISEVLWAGSDVSTADEWVELACVEVTGETEETEVTEEVCVIGGWTLNSLDSKGVEQMMIRFATGTVIGVGEYFLVSNYGAAESRLSIEPDLVTTAVSLSNSKLLLRLRDFSGALIDEVDDGVGDPFAGLNMSPSTGSGQAAIKASMERIDLLGLGNSKANWSTATACQNLDASSPVRGTPGTARSDAICGLSSASSSSASSLLSSTGSSLSSTAAASGSSLFSISSEASSSISSVEDLEPQSSHRVLITEIMADPIGSDTEEWMELGNFGSGSAIMTGWTIVVGTGSTRRTFEIPHGTGSVLVPGMHRLFPGTLTKLTLRNSGNVVSLLSGSLVIDVVEYPAAKEGISFGRAPSDTSILRELCTSSEGMENFDQPIGIRIDRQSGDIIGQGKLTLNLQAVTSSGSALKEAICHWNYGDGFTSESCNPPSHSITLVGTHTITLDAAFSCGQTEHAFLNVEVSQAPSTGRRKSASTVASALTEVSDTPSCRILSNTGIIISEIFPDPLLDEEHHEWIELKNVSGEGVSLCGWFLDDEEEGSKRYPLDHFSVAPGEHVVVSRRDSKIALNNDGDEVRLFAPVRLSGATIFTHTWSGTTLMDTVAFDRARSAESFALRDDRLFVWTPILTPGTINEFRSAERKYEHGDVIVSAALPNPEGKDEEGEWIELMNVSDDNVRLDGWRLDNHAGGSSPYDLSGIWLRPLETKRFLHEHTQLDLTNTKDVARLLDPDGYVASVLGWAKAAEGMIYRPTVIASGRVPVRVVDIIDERTIAVTLSDIEDPDLPPSLLHRWRAQELFSHPFLPVQLIEIEVPFVGNSRAKEFLSTELGDKNIELQFDTDLWNGDEEVRAYAFVTGSRDTVQATMIKNGLALCKEENGGSRFDEFHAYQDEAQIAKLGVWSDAQFTLAYEQTLVASASETESGAEVNLHQKEMPMAVYFGTGVVISEVYPRPLTPDPSPPSPLPPTHLPTGRGGEFEEWIELFNTTDASIDLVGWMLDDKEDGTKPWMISESSVISPKSYLMFSKSKTKIGLNDDADNVRLISPDGVTISSVEYSKLKKGQSLALTTSENLSSLHCITDKPTPGFSNECFLTIVEKPKKKSKTVAKNSAPKTKSIVASNTRWVIPKIDESNARIFASGSLLSMLLKSEENFASEGGRNDGKELSEVLMVVFLMVMLVVICLWNRPHRNPHP